MKKIYLILGIFSVLSCNSQIFQWSKQLGGTTNDVGSSIASDLSGNVYTTGRFSGICDFDPGAGVFNLTSNGGNDIFICKLDASGNFVWAKQIGGTGNEQGMSITVDASGNVYTTGYFANTVDFDPGVGTYTLASTGGDGIFVSKLNSTGSFVWAVHMGGSSNEQGLSIALDGANNVYTTGYFNGISDFDPGVGVFNLTALGTPDIFISKLDVSGNFLWAKRFGTTGFGEFGYSIAVDASSNVYTTGVFSSTTDFDPGAGTFNMTSFGNYDAFISKLDGSGNFIFAKQLGGIGDDYSYGIGLDATGNILLTGQFNSTCDFDPSVSTYTLTSFGMGDIHLTKLDPSGNLIFAQHIGGTGNDVSRSISIDAMGNSFICGSFQNTCDFDPSTSAYNLTSAGLEDAFVCRINASGTLSFARQLGGTATDQAFSITARQPFVYTIGTFNGLGDFDPTSGILNLTPFGSIDVFVNKIAGCGAPPVISGTILGTTTLCVSSSPSIYTIASAQETASYSWSLPSGWIGSSTTNTISATTGTASGNISVTASNACGTSSASVLNVTVNPLPTITANTSSSIICGPPYQGTANISASGASTYTWNTSATTASISVSPSVTTTYTVTGTSTAGCTNTATITQSISACTNINSLSLWERAGVRVFPNPFSTVITILSGGEKQTITIYNILGELVHTEIIEQEKTEIDLHILPSGLYFIKSDSFIQKIVKD